MTSKEKVRLDKYLWAIRIFKTRSQAADACDKGKIKMRGNSIKASRPVHPGDQYEIKTETGKRVIKIAQLLDNRLPYSEAINYYIDITPEEESKHLQFQSSSFHTGKRQSKIGRPTKKQRRGIEDFFGEAPNA